MSSLDGEQFIGATIVINGAHVSGTTAIIKAAAPANTAYTFTKAYSVMYRGQHISYVKSRTYILSADVKALLLAASAPMVAA